MSARGMAGPTPADDAGRAVTTTQLRGSVLLLLGRVVSLLLTLGTQLVLVRVLTLEDFGRLAYALAAVVVLQSVLSLGLDRADSRFLALYELQGDTRRLAGTFVAEAAVVALATAVTVALCAAAVSGALDGVVSPDLTAVLAVVLLLAPLQLLDVFVVNALAVFARPRDVFVRRYVLEPGLRLGVTVSVALVGGGALALGWGFVGASVTATIAYLLLLARLLHRRGLVRSLRPREVTVPWRPLLAFSAPLLVANITAVAATEVAALVLGHYRSAQEVGALRAVQPFAALGLVVLFTFGTLFTPAAARLHGAGDLSGLQQLHWRTTAWIAVLSWPVFALTAFFAAPVVTVALGDRYEGSAVLLVLLAVAAYVNAACGPNGTTVQVLGRVRWMLVTNTLALVGLLALTLTLVPRYGATGAACAVLATAVLLNVAKQAGLGQVGRRPVGHGATFLRLAAATAACWLAAAFGPDHLGYAVLVVVLLSLALLRSSRRQLAAQETFPEAARIPVLRWLLAP